MNAIDFIKQSLGVSREWAIALIDDMRDAPLAQPISHGGNHPLWVLGHLAWSESFLLDCLIRGEENRFPELKSMFDAGTTPTTDADAYPSLDELDKKWNEVRAAMLAHLDSLSEADLDQPSHAPEDIAPLFGTIGKCFGAAVGHPFFHAGEVADVRRAVGKGPLRM